MFLYRSDQEIINLSQTKQQLEQNIAGSPSKNDLSYVEIYEEQRYEKRTEIKIITEEMTINVKKHKTAQDEQLKKNAKLREQLLEARRRLAEAQKEKINEGI